MELTGIPHLTAISTAIKENHHFYTRRSACAWSNAASIRTTCHVVTLCVAISSIAFPAAASQSRPGDAAASQPSVRACAVLTRDLVAPFTENKKMLDLIPPQEEALGTTGTACEYGAVRLQLFPGRGGKRTVSAKDVEPISGAGDGGYFRNNRDRYAELMVWTGKHSLDLQVSVPSGRTAEAIKPEVVALANAIIKKLP